MALTQFAFTGNKMFNLIAILSKYNKFGIIVTNRDAQIVIDARVYRKYHI